jgi:transposase-like protein
VLHRFAGFGAEFVAVPAVAFGVEQQALLKWRRQAGDRGVGCP